jgi:hypothetical protein
MGELVTEARVEGYVASMGQWLRVKGPKDTSLEGTVPEAVEMGRRVLANDLRFSEVEGRPMPVRVVDSAGVVVAQWGRP